MTRKAKPIRSDIAWSTPDRIEVHGKSLPDEILGHLNLGDMAFLQIVGRMPTQQESNVFNAIAVTLVEHGITPSALVARLTYAGAPESLQAAVAAGLCGLGSVFVGSTEGTAKMLYEALPPGTKGADLERIACDTVAAFRARGQIIPGLGHPLHKPVDPRRNCRARGAGHGGERRNRQAGILAKRAEDAAVEIVHLYKLSHAGCDMRKL